jgi:hypothetical protein
MEPCQAEDSNDLFIAKRLRYHIVGPKVERFGPEMFIGNSRAYD